MSILDVTCRDMNVVHGDKLPRRVCCVALAVFALSILGCVYLWRCASMTTEHINLEWLMLKKQLAWNGIGLALAMLLPVAGWRRILKSTPFALAGWLVLLVVGCFCPHGNGSLRVPLGIVQLDVMACSPIVGVMFAAWLVDLLARKFNVRACMVVCVAIVGMVALGAAMMMTSVSVCVHQDADARSQHRLNAQQTCVEAFNAAYWFSANIDAFGHAKLPVRYAFAMPPNTALIFGKWFPASVAVLFGLFAFALVCCWRKAKSEAVKALVFFSGSVMLIPATLGFCGCVGLTPWLYVGVPLVSFGGAAVVSSWLLVGALVAAEMQKEVE